MTSAQVAGDGFGTGEIAAGDGVWAPARRSLLVGLALAITLVAFESLSVVTILPVVTRDLGGLSYYGWVTSAFFLGTIVGLVVAGEQTDRYGPAKPLVSGLIIFAAGLIVCGTATHMQVLVAGRLLQGLGGGAVPSIAYATIGRAYPPALRPQVFAVMATCWVVPGMVGPGVAAVVTEHLSWRLVFAGLVPVVLATAGFSGRVLRRLPAIAAEDGADAVPAARRPVTALPAVQVAAGAALILGGLTARNLLAVPLVAAGVLLGAPPLRRLLPAGTLACAVGLPAVVAVRGLLAFAFSNADSFVPLAIISVRHQSTVIAGLAVTFASMCWAVASWTQARLARSWTGRRMIAVGLLGIVAGMGVLIAGLWSRTPLPVPFIGYAIAGFGIGLSYSPLSSLTLRAAPEGRQGAASASLQLADNLGTALGAGVAGAIVAAMTLGAAGSPVATDRAGAAATAVTASTLSLTFSVAIVVGLIAVVATRRLPADLLGAPQS